MARNIKISNISMRPPMTNTSLECQAMVEGMITHINSRVEKILPDKPDLIVMPEYCDTPANIGDKAGEYFETRGEQVLDYFREVARKNKTYVACSAKRKDEEGRWRNSTTIIGRKGETAGVYDKNHLVPRENTELSTSYGTEARLIECDFGTVACAICFDLNFTELLYKYAKLHPDLIIFSSAYHGGLMQAYWAYACRAHFVGSLRGLPGTILSPIGETIASTTNYYEYVSATVNLDCRVVHIDENSKKFLAMKKKYAAGISIHDPGYLGSVLISNQMESVTVEDLLKEFGIDTVDGYFARARKHRQENM